MFAYIVKRLLAGVVVVAIVSMAIFALFWYGPSSPAQPICDRETSNRVHAGAPRALREAASGYDNPTYVEYGKFAKGVFVGRDMTIGTVHVPVPGPVPGLLLPHQAAGLGGAQGATPRDLLGRHRRCLLLPALRHPHRGRRRAQTRHGDRQGPGVELPVHQLDPVLPLRAADVALPHRDLRGAPLREHRLLPDHGESVRRGSPACSWPGWRSGSSAAPSTPATPAARWSRPSARTTSAPPRPRACHRGRWSTEHGLRAALVPVVTIFGIDFGTLLAGTIFTERIFEIEGIGWWSLQAVQGR